jgi:hypothetical protein
MLNELGEQLAPANAATFNGITLIAARKLAPALKQRRGAAELSIVSLVRLMNFGHIGAGINLSRV